jgi:hypothetical protein
VNILIITTQKALSVTSNPTKVLIAKKAKTKLLKVHVKNVETNTHIILHYVPTFAVSTLIGRKVWLFVLTLIKNLKWSVFNAKNVV